MGMISNMRCEVSSVLISYTFESEYLTYPTRLHLEALADLGGACRAHASPYGTPHIESPHIEEVHLTC